MGSLEGSGCAIALIIDGSEIHHIAVDAVAFALEPLQCAYHTTCTSSTPLVAAGGGDAALHIILMYLVVVVVAHQSTHGVVGGDVGIDMAVVDAALLHAHVFETVARNAAHIVLSSELAIEGTGGDDRRCLECTRYTANCGGSGQLDLGVVDRTATDGSEGCRLAHQTAKRTTERIAIDMKAMHMDVVQTHILQGGRSQQTCGGRAVDVHGNIIEHQILDLRFLLFVGRFSRAGDIAQQGGIAACEVEIGNTLVVAVERAGEILLAALEGEQRGIDIVSQTIVGRGLFHDLLQVAHGGYQIRIVCRAFAAGELGEREEIGLCGIVACRFLRHHNDRRLFVVVAHPHGRERALCIVGHKVEHRFATVVHHKQFCLGLRRHASVSIHQEHVFIGIVGVDEIRIDYIGRKVGHGGSHIAAEIDQLLMVQRAVGIDPADGLAEMTFFVFLSAAHAHHIAIGAIAHGHTVHVGGERVALVVGRKLQHLLEIVHVDEVEIILPLVVNGDEAVLARTALHIAQVVAIVSLFENSLLQRAVAVVDAIGIYMTVGGELIGLAHQHIAHIALVVDAHVVHIVEHARAIEQEGHIRVGAVFHGNQGGGHFFQFLAVASERHAVELEEKMIVGAKFPTLIIVRFSKESLLISRLGHVEIVVFLLHKDGHTIVVGSLVVAQVDVCHLRGLTRIATLLEDGETLSAHRTIGRGACGRGERTVGIGITLVVEYHVECFRPFVDRSIDGMHHHAGH